jgi:hypothetical protein
MCPCNQKGVEEGMTEPQEPLTTDPPRPPGTPSVDDLEVPVPDQVDEHADEQVETDEEDVQSGAGQVEPPD